MKASVKICGISSAEDALAALGCGAEFLGLIFEPKSPRAVTPEQAEEIAKAVGGRAKLVGVFVSQTADFIKDAAKKLNLFAVQLHGGQNAEFVKSLGALDAEIWKVVWLENESDLAEAEAFEADRILVDSKSGSSVGGTGKRANWELAARLAKKRKVILAGGISPENVREAVNAVCPCAVDVNSMVEDSPRKKNHLKIKQLFENLKEMENTQMKSNGKFGVYGGQYVAETLMPALQELEREFYRAMGDADFQDEYRGILRDYVGRETPLYFARRLTEHCGGAQIWLKREDLNHTGAHKINNTIGQALLARRMGKRRLIAETGAGMHGVATATVAALFGMECEVFMGAEDIRRQAQNAARMDMLGAKLTAVEIENGEATLKDAMNEALRDWVATVENTFYVIGTAAGPHPYPTMVKEFQSIIGREAKAQLMEKCGRLPDQVVACVGGGSNAIGLYAPFIDEKGVAIYGAEAAGQGIETGKHSASMQGGSVGVLHGNKTYLLQDEYGQIMDTYSVSAGLDYPGVGPEHAYMKDTGRATYVPINDAQAVHAFQTLCRLEGIIPALESSHAVALAMENAKNLSKDKIIVVSLSGRGDKDMNSVMEYLRK